MNWESISFDWNHVRAFLATVEEGSLSAAARALNQTQATISRQVSALEQNLDVQLFDRIGKRLVLTATGEELLAAVREMATSAQQIALSVTGQAQSSRRRIVVTATDGIAASILPRVFKDLTDIADNVLIDLRETIDVLDLAGREADIAIRHSRSNHQDFVSQHVGDVTAHLCASRTFIRSLGAVQELSDLAQAKFIGIGRLDELIDWLSSAGLHLSIDNFSLNVQSGVVLKEMVREGCGIAVMPLDAPDSDEIGAILPDLFNISVPVWVTVHRKLLMSRRISRVYETLITDLRQHFDKAKNT
ncbi:MAG: LysR family transcriptional regulator [Pseudomonadota bacterium]